MSAWCMGRVAESLRVPVLEVRARVVNGHASVPLHCCRHSTYKNARSWRVNKATAPKAAVARGKSYRCTGRMVPPCVPVAPSSKAVLI